MKTQVQPVPPPDSGHVEWLRPVRNAHDRYSVLAYQKNDKWVEVKSWMTRHDAREMCRNGNLAHQAWFEQRARIAREIEEHKRQTEAAKKYAEMAEVRARMVKEMSR